MTVERTRNYEMTNGFKFDSFFFFPLNTEDDRAAFAGAVSINVKTITASENDKQYRTNSLSIELYRTVIYYETNTLSRPTSTP